MRRFELVEGSSAKFWEIDLDGSSFTVTWGRLGTSGQTQTKSFDSDAKALKEHDKLVAEKTKKGYGEVEATGAPAAATASPKAAPAPKAAATPKPAATATSDDDDGAAPAAPAAPAALQAAAAKKAPPSIAEEDQIFWTDALRKRVMPRRGGISARIPALLNAKKAHAKVIDAINARKSAQDNALKDKLAGADDVARIIGAVVAGNAPENPQDGALLMAWLSYSPTYQIEAAPDDVMEYLWVAASPTLAMMATILAMEMSFSGDQSYNNNDAKPKLLAVPPEHWRVNFSGHGALGALDRLRELLVLADDDVYEGVKAAAAEVRNTVSDDQRVALSFLFSTESLWVSQDFYLLGKKRGYRWVLASATSLEGLPPSFKLEIGELVNHRYNRQGGGDIAATILDGVGTAAAPLLAAVNLDGYTDSAMRRDWFQTLAAIGHDDTIGVIVKHIAEKEAQAALAEFSAMQPRRVMRLVASAAVARGKAGEPARNVLSIMVRRAPELVAEVMPFLDADAQKAVAAVVADIGEAVADAKDEDVPSFLRSPPWRNKKAKAALLQVPGLVISGVDDVLRFDDGEREAFLATTGWGVTAMDAAKWQALADNPKAHVHLGYVVTSPPEHLEVLMARAARDSGRYGDDRWYMRVVATHGLSALPLIEARARGDLSGWLPALLPVGAKSLALMVAQAMASKKTLREPAKRWLMRHPEQATAGLLPIALGKAGKDRDAAEAALRFLDVHAGAGSKVRAVAASAEVDGHVEVILMGSALDTVPNKVPALPTYLDAAALPRPTLKDGRGALPVDATNAVLEMMTFFTLDDPYAGIEVLKEATDPKSLARFSWAVFQSWLVGGATSKENYCLTQLGAFGDDDAARKLAALARVWPGEAAHARAVMALDVLAAIGSDVALMHLNGIALKLKFKGLQTKAQEKIQVIAETRGLTTEELEDRLAPDLGLDDDGSMRLDFGPRAFTVGFDEALRPFVKDDTGARLKDMPKPKKDDDQDKAKEAGERWSQLKKDAKQAASLQILRLEMAMCGQRRFEASQFVELFVQHPLVFHIVRRLVWAVYDADGKKIVNTFRVAEDRTFANGSDDAFVLDDKAKVGIPHTLELDEKTAGAWSGVFGDYELVQPFPQLGRPSFTPTAEQKAAKKLDIVDKLLVKTGKVLGLETRRWRRGAPQDGGVTCWMEKHLPDGRIVYLDLDPGLYTGMLSESPEQTLGSCTINMHSYWGNTDKAEPFGSLDPITFSELVRDLESLRS
jgi:predicted DNA-binding WGR domain protein